MLPKPKIVFLYSEIAGYFLACAKELIKHAEVLIVRWPVNSEAPFELKEIVGLKIICKMDYSFFDLRKKVTEFNPTKIICSGWMDKDYLKIIKGYKKKIPTILTLDNHWNGSLKQKIAALASPFILKNKFTNVWVPGKLQYKFAKKLGFKKIEKGFYCADVELHAANYKKEKVSKTKQFLYVGRYVKHKSIFEMWKAFLMLVDAGEAKDWEMLCVGTGDAFEERIKHAKIKHLGFLQPAELKCLLEKNPIYILPSIFEPWGVSVQEFAIAGCPLIISEKVGAKEMFLEEGVNGFSVIPTIESIQVGMKKMINLNEHEFNRMREESHKKGMSYTPTEWVTKLLAIKL